MCHALGRPDLADNPLFKTNDSRNSHNRALAAEIEKELAKQSTEAWIAVFETAGVPCGPVNNIAQALAHQRAGRLSEAQREEFLLALQAGKVTFENGPPARVFFTTMYQTVMEGMFADPMYGGNKNKAGWKLIGFPGVIAVNYQNIEKYRDKPFPTNPVGISDMS